MFINKKIYSKKVINNRILKQRHINQPKKLFINAEQTDLNVVVIKNFNQKFTNLIQTQRIDVWSGFIIRNVRVFNSFGMFYSTDVIFCNRNFQVIEFIKNFGSQKISSYFPDSHFIYCFAPGIIKFLNIKKGDILNYK